MMKLFKKKKSDKSISNTISQQQAKAFDSPNTVNKKPVPHNKDIALTIPVANNTTEKPQVSRYSPPPIVMPKPRRMLTPTRAILGRFDHDKTQVEDEEPLDLITQQEISPILLPTPHEVEPLMPQILIKPIAIKGVKSQQKSLIQPPQAAPVLSSHSTVMSDDSSRVYESAVESLPESSIENDQVADLPDIPLLRKQQSHQSLNLPSQHQQDSGIASGILSDSSSSTVSPYQKQQQSRSIVPATGPSSTSSATVTPLFQRPQNIKQQVIDVSSSPTIPASASSPVPALNVSDSTVTIQQQHNQKQREEQELLLQLKKQVELMEQQRIKDREEWTRKEQELLEHRQQMMDTLMETKDQLTNALKNKEENNNKAKEAFYQKQLQQQQLHQLQQQVGGMTLHHQQQEHQHMMEMSQENERANHFQGQQQRMVYNYDNEAAHNNNEAVGYEEELLIRPQQRRMVNKSRSDEQLKFNNYNTRPSSRSSHHYNQAIADETATRSSSSAAHHINNDDRRSSIDEGPLMQQQQRRVPLVRRGSASSNKSGYRSEHQSPAISPAVIPPSVRRKGPRPRARSIESARYYEEQTMSTTAVSNHNRMIAQEMNDRMMHPLPPNQHRHTRRSRSVGREARRPPSRASSAYDVYYNDLGGEIDLEDDDEGYMDPNMYDSGYYTHPDYMENVPPPHHRKQHTMLRYNPQEMPPHYGHPTRQPPPPPPLQLQQQPQYGQLYSPAIDYYQQQQHYYQQQQQMRHTPRYLAGARHHHYPYN